MKRLSQIFLYITVALLVIWQLPWCYSFFFANFSRSRFALYGQAWDEFLKIGAEEGRGVVRCDLSGNEYTQEQTDSLLPFFYMRQLTADERFPDTIAGIPVTPREAQMTNISYRISPRDVNSTPVKLYPLLESMSKRVDLEMPNDVFRITGNGIEFVEMATNTVEVEKSERFTEAMKKKGFVFPAYRVIGNPTTRKDYDEGYLMLDNERKLFHVKQVVGRPYVRAVPLPEGVTPEYLFITEFRSRQILGLFTDADHAFYVLNAGYEVIRTGIPSYNPEKESLAIFGNMLDWTVSIRNQEMDAFYALDAYDYSLIKKLECPKESSGVHGLFFTSSYDKFVKPRIR